LFADAKRFFVDVKTTGEEKDGKMMVNLRTACVVVTTQYGDKVAFTKSNRGKQYRDSRGKKTQSKNSWGDVETKLSPLMISETEVKSELERLLGSSHEAYRAFQALQV
jgi:DNA-binding sugar fermentation-stimulating protein